MMDEIWKTITDYPDYQVSSFGKVRSLDRYSVFRELFTRFHKGRVLKQSLTHNGYLFVALSKEGAIKQFLVSRLVAMMFIPNLDIEKKEVNHRDGNKTNNFVGNLEWVTPSENCRHTYRVLKQTHPRGTKGKRVNCCCVLQYSPEGLFIKKWTALTDICKELGFSSSSIIRACNTGDVVCGCIWKRERPKRNLLSVRQSDLNGNYIKDWSSLYNVSTMFDFSVKIIKDCCNGIIKSAYGYTWSFIAVKPELRYIRKKRESRRGLGHNNPFARGDTNHFAKLTSEQVIELKKLQSTGNFSKDWLSERFGITKKHMTRIVNRKAWKHIE